MSKLCRISYTLPVAMARPFSDNSAIRYVIPVVGDVMFSCNGPNTDTGHWRIIHRDSPGGKVRYSGIALLKLLPATSEQLN